MLSKLAAPAALTLAFALPVAPAAAQQLVEDLLGGFPTAATPNCSGGVVYDDGGVDRLYAPGGSNAVTMVQRLAMPGGTTKLDQVCVCLSRLVAQAPTSVNLEIVAYADGGTPGALLGSHATTATAIPLLSPKWFDVNVASANIPASGQLYVGARYTGNGVVLCGDTSISTPLRTMFHRTGNGPWLAGSTLEPGNPPRALMIRADPGTGGGGGGPSVCVPSDTVKCLGAGGRFKVEATYQASGQPVGNARVVKLTDDTAYFWFFNAANVEAVLKVLNGCGLNNRYWVFAGGLTDVRVVLTVTDTANGTVWTRTNPQSTAFQPIQDTSAFATCP
jgi:hypothetical protein